MWTRGHCKTYFNCWSEDNEFLSGAGGVAAPSGKCCEATFEGADRVVISDEMFRNAFQHFWRTDHTVRANFSGLRHHLLDSASTPPLQPLQGGEYVLVQHSFHNPRVQHEPGFIPPPRAQWRRPQANRRYSCRVPSTGSAGLMGASLP